MTLPNQTSFVHRVQLDGEIDYVEPQSTQRSVTLKQVILVNPNSVNLLVSLNTLFPTMGLPVVLVLQDVSNPVASGFSFGFNSAASCAVRAGSIVSIGLSSFPLDVYISNPSPTMQVYLLIAVTGS